MVLCAFQNFIYKHANAWWWESYSFWRGYVFQFCPLNLKFYSFLFKAIFLFIYDIVRLFRQQSILNHTLDNVAVTGSVMYIISLNEGIITFYQHLDFALKYYKSTINMYLRMPLKWVTRFAKCEFFKAWCFVNTSSWLI